MFEPVFEGYFQLELPIGMVLLVLAGAEIIWQYLFGYNLLLFSDGFSRLQKHAVYRGKGTLLLPWLWPYLG